MAESIEQNRTETDRVSVSKAHNLSEEGKILAEMERVQDEMQDLQDEITYLYGDMLELEERLKKCRGEGEQGS
jgi:predicted nuclease with TOPRIM domain